MKQCSKCGEVKPLDEFYRDARLKDGRRQSCKTCEQQRDRLRGRAYREEHLEEMRAYGRAYGEEHREERRAYGRAYWAANADAVLERTRSYREQYPERYAATNAVNHAIATGRLTRPEQCQRCGSRENIHAHHEDYSQPLSVEWFCALCHARHHAEQRRANEEREGD